MRMCIPSYKGLAGLCTPQWNHTGADAKISAQYCPEASMGQHVVVPVLLTNQPGCTMALRFIQPAHALIHTP